MNIIAVGLGGALGAMCRAGLSWLCFRFIHPILPIGTLCANLLGSFFMGCLLVLLLEVWDVSSFWRNAILIGFLGAFTTFSSFTADFWQLNQQSNLIAILYAAVTVLGCLFLTWLGMTATNWILT